MNYTKYKKNLTISIKTNRLVYLSGGEVAGKEPMKKGPTEKEKAEWVVYHANLNAKIQEEMKALGDEFLLR